MSLLFPLPLSSLWDGSANADTEGMVRIATCFAGSPGHTVVCIKRYGTYEWELLKNLSTVLWMRYRYRIHNSILPYICSIPKKKDNKLVSSLLIVMTAEQRTKWLAENTEYKDKVCIECGSFDIEKKKCIHHDCSGMCAKCFDVKNKTGFETCACCDKKQEITCPICQEDFTPENLIKSEQCSHHICWACFGRSVKSTRPLSHCPLCRGVFCEKLIDEDIDWEESSDDDVTNDIHEYDEQQIINDFNNDTLEGEIDEELDNSIHDFTGLHIEALLQAIVEGTVTIRNHIEHI